MKIKVWPTCGEYLMFDVRDDEPLCKRFVMGCKEDTITIKEVYLFNHPQKSQYFGNGHDILNRGVLGLEAQLRAYFCVDIEDAARAGKIQFDYEYKHRALIGDWIRDQVLKINSKKVVENEVSFDLSQIKDLYAVMNDGTKISITNNILKVSK